MMLPTSTSRQSSVDRITTALAQYKANELHLRIPIFRLVYLTMKWTPLLATIIATLAPVAFSASIPSSAANAAPNSEDPFALHGVSGFKWPSKPVIRITPKTSTEAESVVSQRSPRHAPSPMPSPVDHTDDGSTGRAEARNTLSPVFRRCITEAAPNAGFRRRCVASSLKL